MCYGSEKRKGQLTTIQGLEKRGFLESADNLVSRESYKSFDMDMMFEAFIQMVMHVCSWLMRFAELSKRILLSSKAWGMAQASARHRKGFLTSM